MSGVKSSRKKERARTSERLGASAVRPSVHSVSGAVMEWAATSFSSTLVSFCLHQNVPFFFFLRGETCGGSRLSPSGTAKGPQIREQHRVRFVTAHTRP